MQKIIKNGIGASLFEELGMRKHERKRFKKNKARIGYIAGSSDPILILIGLNRNDTTG